LVTWARELQNFQATRVNAALLGAQADKDVILIGQVTPYAHIVHTTIVRKCDVG
jgi:hypothetical protein